jgi:aryl-alcohol dehydrogenase-like predicted oxidoreductase
MNEKTMQLASAAGTIVLGGDLVVHRLGFGAMRLTGEGVWGPPKDRSSAVSLLRRALDLEVNFIDTADSYGPSICEEIIVEALAPYPKNLVIATKGGYCRIAPHTWTHNASPDHLRKAVEGSLKRLHLDRIDLYQLHGPDPAISFEASVETLAELRSQGMIRHVGLSNVTREHVERARKIVPIVSVQNRYSFADREWDYLVDYCQQNEIAFIPWAPTRDWMAGSSIVNQIAQAHGATPTQIALAWLLKRSPTVLPIPGTSSAEHLEENVCATFFQLTDDERKQLSTVKKQFRTR